MKKRVLAVLLSMMMIMGLLLNLTYALEPEENYVAKIGDTYYTTMLEAWNAAVENGNATVTVLTDTEMEKDGSVFNLFNDIYVTLDLNGHTLNVETPIDQSSGDKKVWGFYRGVLTIKDGTLKSSGELTGGPYCTIIIDKVDYHGVISPFGGTLQFVNVTGEPGIEWNTEFLSFESVTKPAGAVIPNPYGYYWKGDTDLTEGFVGTVTWKNDDGTELKTDREVLYGTTPKYDENGATPTKAATAQYTYTFKEWSPEISPVKGDVTYTAFYDATINVYTVTFEAFDGEVVPESVPVPYGGTLSTLPIPTRDGLYRFNGWYLADGTPVTTATVFTGDTTVYAQWNHIYIPPRPITYTLYFAENGGTSIADITAEKGTIIALDGYVTSREGYNFTGWYADPARSQRINSVVLNQNTTIYAGWEKVEPKPVAPHIPGKLNGADHFAYILGYTDGTVQPEANITRAEVATIFFRLLNEDVRSAYLTDRNDFSDVPAGKWYTTSVSTMAAMGVLKGANGSFRPDDPITRAEFAAIAARFADKTGTKSVYLMDINGHWAASEIRQAASQGWIEGYNGFFRPDDAITRAEAVTIINRVLCRAPETTADLLAGMKLWTDNLDTAKWYYLAIQEATNSHTYIYKNETFETWTGLTADPDWSRYQ